ncbi:MAG: MFS transporter [Ruminococcaceae bacterium]|nr:MFS transporter [Oscillospiraceae bacterium]
MKKQATFRRTTVACFCGIGIQALISNLTPVLFLPLMQLYDLSYIHLGILVAVNFIAQVCVDIAVSGFVDRVGYRRLVLPGVITAGVGLILFGLSPVIFPDVFTGILISTILISMAAGLLEVLLSPIINSIPSENNSAAMGLLHSFYAWGQAAVIIITTLFLWIFGSENWQWIVFFWISIPLTTLILFLPAPFPETQPEETRTPIRKLFFHPFFLFTMLAIFAGAASEIVMNQWASTYMEGILHIPKVQGDLLGMCGYAIMMGIGRTLYGLKGRADRLCRVMIGSSALAFICYAVVAISPIAGIGLAFCALCGVATAMLWPGTLLLASERFPAGGAWIFAILASAGDIGAAFAPWLTGLVADSPDHPFAQFISGLLQIPGEEGAVRAGLLCAAAFPLIAFVSHIIIRNMRKKHLHNINTKDKSCEAK